MLRALRYKILRVSGCRPKASRCPIGHKQENSIERNINVPKAMIKNSA